MLEQFNYLDPEQNSLLSKGYIFKFDGKEINDQRRLFDAFGNGLLAPNGYFGLNWNAFEDSLMDLQWLSEFKVNIVHENLLDLDEGDLKVYLEILGSAVSKWNNPKTLSLQEQFPEFIPHELIVCFPVRCQPLILSVLTK